MIRTLDASDFIEPKKKRPLYHDLSSSTIYSPAKVAELQQCRELFGIKGALCQKDKGMVVYREGEDGNIFYLLQKGSVTLNINQGMIVESVKPFEFFGVESVFSKKWLTTAIVNDAAELYEFKNSDLVDSIDFRKGSELLKIVEQAYTKEKIKLLLYKISPFIGINENELNDIVEGITILPFNRGQIIELGAEDGLHIISEGKMISVRDTVSDSTDSVYRHGDIIYKPLFKLAGEEDGELLKLSEKLVHRMACISESFKGRIGEELKKREKYVKPASDKQKSAESAAQVISDNEQKPPAVTENKSDVKKEKKMERLSSHEIRLFLSTSPVFGSIGLEEKSKIASCAELACFDKNQEIIKAGTFGEGKFYIIKKGQVKIVKSNSRGNIITAGWLEEGDFFGEIPLIYNVENGEAIISLTNIELLAINKDDFKDIYGYYPSFKTAIINRLKERTRGFSEIENNIKALSIMNFMIENGLTYAANLKIYELNKCINCFSCVKACKERHGIARFRRVGPKYSYASIAQSCRTCKHPTCLSKCRKGAIILEDDGEIAINSKCVGCGLCAKSCSFGAIEVIESEIVNGKAKRKSVKCEHCRGYSNCACVSECPTGAIKHVDPRAYFKHLLTQQEVK
jgi:Fe-S-cluster-containing hydrogenase component 2/CRP-like cAMP-binding protein